MISLALSLLTLVPAQNEPKRLPARPFELRPYILSSVDCALTTFGGQSVVPLLPMVKVQSGAFDQFFVHSLDGRTGLIAKEDVRKPRELVDELTTKSKTHPLTASELLLRACGHFVLSERPESMRDCEACLKMDPEYFAAHVLIALIQDHLKHNVLAETHFAKALKVDPTNPAILNLRAISRIENRRMADASDDIKIALEQEPTFAFAYYSRARMCQVYGQQDTALANVSRAIELEPFSALSFFLRASLHHSMQDFDGEIRDLSAGIRISPYAGHAYLARAAAYDRLDNFELAAGDYSTLIHLEPNRAEAFAGRGMMLMRLSRPDLASADFDKAIALKPRHAKFYTYHGTAMRDLQRFDDALADFEQAIALDPNDATAHAAKGQILQDRKEYAKSILAFDEAIKSQPDCASYFAKRSNSCLQLGKTQEAISDLSQAVRLERRNIKYFVARSNAYLRSGNSTKAIFDLESALSIDPTADCQNALARLLLTIDKSSLRDGTRALELAKDACKLTNHKNCDLLLTLAAAHHESHDTAQAKATANQALSLAVEPTKTRIAEWIKSDFSTPPPFASNP